MPPVVVGDDALAGDNMEDLSRVMNMLLILNDETTSSTMSTAEAAHLA